MEGQNFVSLKGYLKWPEYKELPDRNSGYLKGKIAVPVDNKFQYIKIAAWGDIATDLSTVNTKQMLYIHGHIEEQSYNKSCSFCGGNHKTYWTEVVVDNFMVI